MTVNVIFKIAAVGILISVLNQILKHSGRDDQAFLTSLAGMLQYLIQYGNKDADGCYFKNYIDCHTGPPGKDRKSVV